MAGGAGLCGIAPCRGPLAGCLPIQEQPMAADSIVESVQCWHVIPNRLHAARRCSLGRCQLGCAVLAVTAGSDHAPHGLPDK